MYLYPYGNRLFKECQDSFFSWEDDVNNPVAKEGINFNIDKRFTIVKKFEDYREFYGFGAVTGVDITTNYYLQNIKFFEKFIIFFKIRSVQLIKLYSKEKIYIPPQDIILPKAQNSEDIFDSNFINEFNLNKLIINDISLTRREVDCLKLFLKGFTTKKIASILKKSPRTVETQIDSIKTKLNCFNKNELITKTIGCISIINDF